MIAVLTVKHRVKNYETWKATFDEMEPVRRRHGWLSTQVLRDATDPNWVTIVNRVRSLEDAKAYGASPDLKAAMQKGGIEGAPEVAFLSEAETHSY
jgi:hypothetical protein